MRHNVAVNLAEGSAFGAALGFGSFGTILPLFVSQFTHSALLLGLVPAIHAVGWQLPQLFTANMTARLRRYKPAVLTYTVHERIPFVLLAIVALLSPRLNSDVILTLTFALLIWQGLGGGLTANPWQSMLAKIIPTEVRGTFLGTQASLANLAFSLTAIAAGYLLDFIDSPMDFALCFLLTGAFMAVSYLGLALTREPEDIEKVLPEKSSAPWEGAGQILRTNPNFARFVGVRILQQFGAMSFAFYIIYGLQRFGIDPVTAGFLTATLAVTQTIANAGMGWFGDRLGHRSMLIAGGLAAAVSSLIALAAPSSAWLYPAFVLAGIANVSIWTIAMAMTVEFGSDAERPIYIGLSNTLVAPATILAPVVGGLIAESRGFSATFALAAMISLLAVAILFAAVRDPVGRGIEEGYEPVP